MGGSRLVVPIERVGLGGVVGRRVRIWLFMVRGSGKTYWRGWFCLDGFYFKKCVWVGVWSLGFGGGLQCADFLQGLLWFFGG